MKRILFYLVLLLLVGFGFAIGDGSPGAVMATLWGPMVTGAGVVTTIDFENGFPQFLLVGTVDTDLPVTKFEVTIAGQSFQNITGQSLIQAFSKYMMESLLGADVKVGQTLMLSNGFLGNQNGQVKLTNAGVTTPNIYYHSVTRGNEAFGSGMVPIQDLGSKRFTGFLALFFDPTNFDYANVTFKFGNVTWTDKFTAVELAALFARDNNADADGKLAGITVIDNRSGAIVGVELYANGGALNVLQVA